MSCLTAGSSATMPPLFIIFLFFQYFSARMSAAMNMMRQDLDSTIRDCAFKELSSHNSRTGTLYQITLPSNLSGVHAAAMRLRANSFWSQGANTTAFRIPPGVIPVPHVKRLVIICQNLDSGSSSSSSYYQRFNSAVPVGYSAVGPLISFLTYNASSAAAELDLRVVAGHPMLISFPVINSSGIKCAKFRRDGSVQISDAAGGEGKSRACLTTSTGHFTMVLSSSSTTTVLAGEAEGGKSRWWIWVVAGGGGGVVGLSLLLVILLLQRECSSSTTTTNNNNSKKRKMMEEKAEEEEALGCIWIGESKMPAATLTIRTQTMLENETSGI